MKEIVEFGFQSPQVNKTLGLILNKDIFNESIALFRYINFTTKHIHLKDLTNFVNQIMEISDSKIPMPKNYAYFMEIGGELIEENQ